MKIFKEWEVLILCCESTSGVWLELGVDISLKINTKIYILSIENILYFLFEKQVKISTGI